MPALSVTRRQALLLAAALVLALVVGGRVFLHGGAAAAPANPPSVAVATATAPTVSAIVVDVVGAVRRPGLYRLAGGTRIADAVARAGGATAKADIEGINLAAPLADGLQVLVPRRGSAGATSIAVGGSSGGASPTSPISLSSATSEQLDSLPGVGPVTAQKIVDYRTQHGAFHSVAELDAIPGIGPARIEQLKGLVVP
jgi:competence protein ComEA